MPPELSDHPILLVDDEPPNLHIMERFLRRKYRDVLCAEDGEKALWIVESQRVDLILADQRMPRLSGTELLSAAKELQPRAMRVLVTGAGDVETFTAAINAAQVFQVITKPIDFKIMDMVVQRALEAHEAAAREQEMFDAFVFAAVNAMEQRDPSTAGHSFRVAMMTTGLAMAVDRVSEGPLAAVRFGRDDIAQIKYASLLHDFGKLCVPEEILLKSHKLPPVRLALFQQRIRHAVALGRIDELTGVRLQELLTFLNEPGTSAAAHQPELESLERSGLAAPEDLRYLRIERGSLAPEERAAIQTHVAGTIRFLQQIPWPRRYARVPEIAGAHHEKLNGTGYPAGTREPPVEARMMTICDIYDALCARDRPYRIAASPERAIELLGEMVRNGEIDPLLLDVFVKGRVYLRQNAARARGASS